jgi:2-aminoadipate transaminase
VLDSQFRDDETPCYRGNVIYLSTFSKTLAPGLRLGWVIAPPEVIAKLIQAKQGADLHTATFNQFVAYEVSRGGFLDRHIHLIRDVYGKRRDIMLAAMDLSRRWIIPVGHAAQVYGCQGFIEILP